MKIQPSAMDAFTPKIARLFIVNWARHRSFRYDFFHTPKGPVIFYTRDKTFWIRCNWRSNKERSVTGRELFMTELAEELALAFGWKHNVHRKPT